MSEFTVTTNPFRVDVWLNTDEPHISVPLWKITSDELYKLDASVGGNERHKLIDYCIAFSMEDAIEVIKAKYQSWAELDDRMVMIHILSVEFVSDTVLVQREVVEAFAPPTPDDTQEADAARKPPC